MASIEDLLVICVGMDSVHHPIAYSNTKYRLESFVLSYHCRSTQNLIY